jgi:hypothetical protein
MRVYIINADDPIVSSEPPAQPGENKIVSGITIHPVGSG